MPDNLTSHAATNRALWERLETALDEELTGRLGAVSLAELLQWPGRDRRSGALVVRTARREKRRCSWAGGRVVCIVSGGNIDASRLRTILDGGVPD